MQFECSARYRLMSSERDRNEGSSEASKQGRILEARTLRISDVMDVKTMGDDRSSGWILCKELWETGKAPYIICAQGLDHQRHTRPHRAGMRWAD